MFIKGLGTKYLFKRFHIRTQSNLYRLFRSYIFIIIVLLLLMVTATSRLQKNVVDTWMKQNLNNSLSQANDYVDNTVFSLPNNLSKRVLQNIFENPSLSYFFYFSEYNYSNVKYIQTYFNSILTSNKQIASVSLYYGKSNYLITPYYNGLLSEVDREGHFSKMLMDSSYKEPFYWLYVGSPSIFTGSSSKINLSYPREIKFLYFIRKIPSVAFSTEHGGSIIIAVNEHIFHNEIRNFFPENTDVFITSLDGTILFSSGGSHIMANISEFEGFDQPMGRTEGNYIKKINGVDTLVSYKKSTFSNYMFVALSPISPITKSFTLLFRVLGTVAALTFLLGIILSFFSAKFYSAPLVFLKNVCVNILNKYVTGNSLENEFDVINYTVDVLSDKLNRHENNIKEVSPLVYEHIFSSLINKNRADRDIYDKLNFANIGFGKEYFSCVVFKAKIISEFSSVATNPEYIIREIVESVEHFTSPGEYEYINVRIENRMAYIFNYGRETNFLKTFTAISYHLSKFTGIRIYMGISDRYHSLDETGLAYRDAVWASNYSFMTPDKNFYLTSSIKAAKKDNPSALIRFVKQMKVCLNNNHWDSYISLSDKLCKVIRENPFSYNDVTVALKKVVTDIYNYSSEFNIAFDDISPDTSKMLKSFKDIDDFHMFLHLRISHISNILERRKISKNIEFINSVKQYVDANISTDKISQEALADYFGISSAHLSRLFKEIAHENYIDYVTGKKLEFARDKLLTTNMSVDSISKLVGYANTQYFISKFKVKYGKTPQKFRVFNESGARNPSISQP